MYSLAKVSVPPPMDGLPAFSRGCEMSTTSFPAHLCSISLALVAFCALPVMGIEQETAGAISGQSSQLEQAYRKAIATIESTDGAYAEGLSESLLSLARNLQSQDRHNEAIELFRRGSHLARINEGLYCEQQIPLVSGEIGSHVSTGNFTLADQRQNYLLRVQLRALPSGEPLTDALAAHAKWQFQAYRRGRDEGYTRLRAMSDYYESARDNVIAREGKTSPNQLPPLYGLLQAQYLIASHRLVEPVPRFGEESERLDQDIVRFNRYQGKSYAKGNALIDAIYTIKQEHFSQDKLNLAQTLVMLGDWRLWNGNSADAFEAYSDAEAELAEQDDAQLHTRQLFGEPVPLPDFPSLSPLPSSVNPEEAHIRVTFGVNEKGKVEDIERLDENDNFERQARNIMRTLRRTKFRPRFEAGQPLETPNLVKAFSIQ